MRKNFRSVISLVLVFAMLLSCSVTAFANTMPEETLNYVSLGDSMTNGYGLPGYGDEGDGQEENDYGFENYGEGTYADAFADLIDATDYKQYAMSGMRASDLRLMLELTDSAAKDYITKIGENSDNFDQATWNTFFNCGDWFTAHHVVDHPRCRHNDGIVKVAEKIQDGVADADVISLAIGNADMGAYMLSRLMGAIGFGDADTWNWINVENLLQDVDAETRAVIMEAYGKVRAEIAALAAQNGMDGAMIDKVANVFAYNVADFMINYSFVLDDIVAVNPDVTIMQVGLMNSLNGMMASYGGETFDVGEYVYTAINVVNAYIAGLAAVKQEAGLYPETVTFLYAEASNVDVLIEEFSKDLLDSNDTIRDRFVDSIVGEYKGFDEETQKHVWSGMIWNLKGFPKEAGLDLETVKRLEKVPAGGLKGDQKTLIETYLGIENAILKACENNAPVALESLLKLGDLANADPMDLIGDAGLLHMFARMLIGEGIGAHPSASGHEQIFEEVKASWENGYTSGDATEDNLKEVAESLYAAVMEYYDDAYAYAYKYAAENGYINTAIAGIDEAIAALEAADLNAVEMTDEFRTKLATEIDSIVATLEKAEALIVEADVLDQATWEAFVATMDEAYVAWLNLAVLAEQAGVDLYDLVYVPAVDKLFNEIIPAVKAALWEAVEKGTAWLQAKVDELYAAFVEAMEELIPAIGNWMWENRSYVFSALKHLGMEVVDFVIAHQDEICKILNYIVEKYGQEYLDEILCIKGVLENMVEWYEMYGDKVWALIDKYLLNPNPEQIKADAIALLTYLWNEFVGQYINPDDALLKQFIADMEKLIDILSDVNCDDIKAAIEGFLAELEVKYAAMMFDATHNAYTPDEDSFYLAIGGETADGTGLSSKYDEYWKLLGEELKVADYNVLIEDAWNGEVILSYADDIAAADLITYQPEASDIVFSALTGTADWSKYFDADELALMDEMMTVVEKIVVGNWAAYAEQEIYTIAAEIRADVLKVVPENILNKVVSEEDINGILALCVAQVKTAADMAAEGGNVIDLYEEINATTNNMAENLIFGLFSYVVDTIEVLETIQTINPDANVLVLGLYNPADGLKIAMDGEVIDLGEYMDYLVELSKIFCTAYAVADGNVAFVDIAETEINGFGDEPIDLAKLDMSQMNTVLDLMKKMHANNVGHEYIAEQIFAALTETTEEPEDKPEYVLPEIDKGEPEGGEGDEGDGYEDLTGTTIKEGSYVVNEDEGTVTFELEIPTVDKEGNEINTQVGRVTYMVWVVDEKHEDGGYAVPVVIDEETGKAISTVKLGATKLQVYINGNMNSDTIVDIRDVRALLISSNKYATNPQPTGFTKVLEDMNGDKVVDIRDVRALLLHSNDLAV